MKSNLNSIIFLAIFSFYYIQNINAAPNFCGTYSVIPHNIQQKMIGVSWKSECPLPLEDLCYLNVTHWGYDGQIKIGHMIIHKSLAAEMLEIFKELFDARFQIERMQIIDEYDADDDRSMQANNSSAFCFRANTTNPSVISKHGYGYAVDINPLINPYIKGDLVLPEGSKAYLDRTQNYPGMITDNPNNICYQAFTKRSWFWGGHFEGRRDYQHFEKERTTR